jgi:hypothetical protein
MLPCFHSRCHRERQPSAVAREHAARQRPDHGRNSGSDCARAFGNVGVGGQTVLSYLCRAVIRQSPKSSSMAHFLLDTGYG